MPLASEVPLKLTSDTGNEPTSVIHTDPSPDANDDSGLDELMSDLVKQIPSDARAEFTSAGTDGSAESTDDTRAASAHIATVEGAAAPWVLTASEECAPRLDTHDYMKALLNTDPRAAFDMVHFGALCAMEECDSQLSGWSSWVAGPSWVLPGVRLSRSPYHGPTSPISAAAGKKRTRANVSAGAAATGNRQGALCFEVEGIHARVYRRSAIRGEEQDVDELLSSRRPAESARRVLGPDLLQLLRRSRVGRGEGKATAAATGMRRRRKERRSSP